MWGLVCKPQEERPREYLSQWEITMAVSQREELPEELLLFRERTKASHFPEEASTLVALSGFDDA